MGLWNRYTEKTKYRIRKPRESVEYYIPEYQNWRGAWCYIIDEDYYSSAGFESLYRAQSFLLRHVTNQKIAREEQTDIIIDGEMTEDQVLEKYKNIEQEHFEKVKKMKKDKEKKD